MAIMEEGPQVHAIGAWVLEEAMRFVAHVRAQGGCESFHVAVNVAPRQLHGDGFVASVERALAQAGVPADALVLEITESSLVDVDHALPALARIRALGVRIAVDDFGTGYSSLSYLHRLPLDILKVDRSFVADVDQSVELRAMTRAILTLGRSLGIETVAEGVERPAQVSALQRYGCAAAQGFLWSPPVPGDDLVALLAEHRATAELRG